LGEAVKGVSLLLELIKIFKAGSGGNGTATRASLPLVLVLSTSPAVATHAEPASSEVIDELTDVWIFLAGDTAPAAQKSLETQVLELSGRFGAGHYTVAELGRVRTAASMMRREKGTRDEIAKVLFGLMDTEI
jgi:hypothetical protein